MKVPKPGKKDKSALKKILEEAQDAGVKGAVKKTLKQLEKAGNEPMQRDREEEEE
jgi:hypothetical protein